VKVIIAGSRYGVTMWDVEMAMNRCPWPADQITEVVSGMAKDGGDAWGRHWARVKRKPVTRFPAPWRQYGRAAGPIRNRQMAEYADALVALWDGESRGTKNMIEEMEKLGKPVYIWRPVV
jgi:hypothetical protein